MSYFSLSETARSRAVKIKLVDKRHFTRVRSNWNVKHRRHLTQKYTATGLYKSDGPGASPLRPTSGQDIHDPPVLIPMSPSPSEIPRAAT